MVVTREIDGKVITITLTKAEMRKAFSIVEEEMKIDDVKLAFEHTHDGMNFPYGKDALTIIARKADALRAKDNEYWGMHFYHPIKATEEYEMELR